MSIVGLDQFGDDPRLNSAIARASDLLKAELGRSVHSVDAVWSRAADRKRPIVVLTLSDRSIEEPRPFEARFTLGDLLDEDRVQHQLIHLWGDVLQYRSQKLLEPILQSIQEHEGKP